MAISCEMYDRTKGRSQPCGDVSDSTEEYEMTQHSPDIIQPDELLTIDEAAALLRAPVATLRYWRHIGTGPRSFRVGRAVRYWHNDVVTWLDEQVIHSGAGSA
jgi:predicted DNA-binding transcriptional regulator AlpA